MATADPDTGAWYAHDTGDEDDDGGDSPPRPDAAPAFLALDPVHGAALLGDDLTLCQALGCIPHEARRLRGIAPVDSQQLWVYALTDAAAHARSAPPSAIGDAVVDWAGDQATEPRVRGRLVLSNQEGIEPLGDPWPEALVEAFSFYAEDHPEDAAAAQLHAAVSAAVRRGIVRVR